MIKNLLSNFSPTKSFLFFVFLVFGYIQSFSQNISTIAGTGTQGFSADGTLATSANLNLPYSITVFKGTIYFVDRNNQRIRKIENNGTLKTVAGNGVGTFAGDGGLATDASLRNPYSIAFDTAGNMFIADFSSNRIRKVTPAGIISTIAGTGSASFSGDGGTATAATLNSPTGLCLDTSGNIYIADYGNNRIRKINKSGIISTVAGSSTSGFSGDGGLATAATLRNPYDVTADIAGNLYIADFLNHRIRKVTLDGIINTIAGSGATGNNNGGFGGDGGLATAAVLNAPARLIVDSFLNIYIADYGNHRIRKVANTTGFISTVAGNGSAAFAGDGAAATAASINTPIGLALDTLGNLLIADLNNHRIRKVTPTVLPLKLASFSAVAVSNAVHLSWITSNELNIASFIIQRSQNGIDFFDIGVVAANGNATSNTKYTFSDVNPINGKNYYRLKIVDEYKKKEFSTVLQFGFGVSNGKNLLKIYPNPATDFSQIQIVSDEATEAVLQIVDLSGKIVSSHKKSLSVGTNVFTMNSLSELQAGTYLVKAIINGKTITEKLHVR